MKKDEDRKMKQSRVFRFFGDVWKAAEWAVVFVFDNQIAADKAAAI